MTTLTCDVAVIGGGPAGLSAAAAAKKQGAEKVLILERDTALGGILQQCIHPGFGLTYYGEELTGPEYAGRFIEEARELGVETLLDSMVLEVSPQGEILCVNGVCGMTKVKAGGVVLAMGCREKTRGNLQIPGTRPAGVYTAGAAQRLLNRQNELVGKKVVILGSGDIGMIMARRLTLEGAKVEAVVELLPYLAGLTRNRVQCLDDFGIPLLLSHTVSRILGNRRVEGVMVAEVDENRRVKPETERRFDCDTLLLSVGLMPENELSRGMGVALSPITNGPVVNQFMQTDCPAIFASGNVVHVNDLVDHVSLESAQAGAAAARYAAGTFPQARGEAACRAGENVRYVCPQRLLLTEGNEELPLYFRVLSPETDVVLTASQNGEVLAKRREMRVNPGEMESLSVPMERLTAGEIVITVTREAQA